MTDRRQLDRSDLSTFLAVNDAKTNEALGHLADINICGFLLINPQSLPTGQRYKIKVILPEAIDGKEDITCEAICRRCNKAANTSYFEMGFEITEIHPSERYVLEKVILQYERKLRQAAS